MYINGRPVISSGQYGEKFSNMVISVDPDTKQILSMQNTVYDAFAYTAALTPDPAVAAIVSAAVTAADAPGNVVLGKVNFRLQPRQLRRLPVANRGTESTLGNFVADVQLWSANQNGRADIALMNPGGLHADLAFAPARVDHVRGGGGRPAFRQYPRHPRPHRCPVEAGAGTTVATRAELRAQPVLRPGRSSEGLAYVYDPTAAAGSHITRVTFNGSRRWRSGNRCLQGRRQLVPRRWWRQLRRHRAGEEQGRQRQGRSPVDGRLLRGEQHRDA